MHNNSKELNDSSFKMNKWPHITVQYMQSGFVWSSEQIGSTSIFARRDLNTEPQFRTINFNGKNRSDEDQSGVDEVDGT